MTTVNTFDSTRQPYTLELGERFNSPYDFYAWRNGQPFTFLAVVNPGEDPAVDDDDYGSMFRTQGQQRLCHPIGVPPVAHSRAQRGRPRPALRRPPRRARPIISMLSRWVPPITCSRPGSPGRLTRTQIGLSQPCSARTDGSNASPSRAAARA